MRHIFGVGLRSHLLSVHYNPVPNKNGSQNTDYNVEPFSLDVKMLLVLKDEIGHQLNSHSY